MREFTAVSLFCGAGGLDMGFDRVGFRTIWAMIMTRTLVKLIRTGAELRLFVEILVRLISHRFQILTLYWAVFRAKGFL